MGLDLRFKIWGLGLWFRPRVQLGSGIWVQGPEFRWYMKEYIYIYI